MEPLPQKWASSLLALNIDAAPEPTPLDELSALDGVGQSNLFTRASSLEPGAILYIAARARSPWTAPAVSRFAFRKGAARGGAGGWISQAASSSTSATSALSSSTSISTSASRSRGRGRGGGGRRPGCAGRRGSRRRAPGRCPGRRSPAQREEAHADEIDNVSAIANVLASTIARSRGAGTVRFRRATWMRWPPSYSTTHSRVLSRSSLAGAKGGSSRG